MNEINLEHRITAVEKLAGSNKYRIDALEKQQDALNKIATSVEVIANEQGHITRSVENLETKVDILEARPGQWWDKLIAAGIGAVVVAAVTAAVNLF